MEASTLAVISFELDVLDGFLRKRYNRMGADSWGVSPELDSIMVITMGWILAPVDVSITWIRKVKEAEEARIRNQKKVL